MPSIDVVTSPSKRSILSAASEIAPAPKELFVQTSAEPAAAPVAVISPTESDSEESITEVEVHAPEEATHMVIGKTQHKQQEEAGLHQEEPLLMENPHRFVLFPIQDNEVSLHACLSLRWQCFCFCWIGERLKRSHRSSRLTVTSPLTLSFSPDLANVQEG